MYTLDIKLNQKHALKTAFIYLVISIFLVLFGAVYEKFSHEVYSYYMIYAFFIPLFCGAFTFSVLSFLDSKIYPNSFSRNLYHSSIATLTLGSLIQGILNIYGTTNQLTKYYWLIGFMLFVIAIVVYIVQLVSIDNKSKNAEGSK